MKSVGPTAGEGKRGKQCSCGTSNRRDKVASGFWKAAGWRAACKGFTKEYAKRIIYTDSTPRIDVAKPDRSFAAVPVQRRGGDGATLALDAYRTFCDFRGRSCDHGSHGSQRRGKDLASVHGALFG